MVGKCRGKDRDLLQLEPLMLATLARGIDDIQLEPAMLAMLTKGVDKATPIHDSPPRCSRSLVCAAIQTVGTPNGACSNVMGNEMDEMDKMDLMDEMDTLM